LINFYKKLEKEMIPVLNNWHKRYTELTNFITKHSEIKIEVGSVYLPDSIRPEFYRFFDAVRTSFIEERFPILLNEAKALSQNYLKAEKQTTALLKLDDVSMEARLSRFLNSPIDQLIRILFTPLFDLLKGKVDVGIFEQTASRNIKVSFGHLYQSGYEKWVSVSLLNLLKADRLFQITPREFTSESEKARMGLALPTEGNPPPEGSRHLSFKHNQDAVFIVPDFIVHSAKVNRYVALRSQMGKPYATASNTSEKREWLHPDSKSILDPGITFVYVADNPEEISLVADASKICKPDFIIECREQKGWYEQEGLERVKLHHDSLKPRLGTYMVSMELVPDQKPEKQKVDIHILSVGFDSSKLAPIVNSINNDN
jgi:hypothetical protein